MENHSTPIVKYLYVTDVHKIDSSQVTSTYNNDADYLGFEFEMITIGATTDTDVDEDDDQDKRYTSLKDISAPPELSQMDSWREVPLKDPLVQQAAWAWAYMPLITADHHHKNGFVRKIKDGFIGCFKNVIVAIATQIFLVENHITSDIRETAGM